MRMRVPSGSQFAAATPGRTTVPDAVRVPLEHGLYAVVSTRTLLVCASASATVAAKRAI